MFEWCLNHPNEAVTIVGFAASCLATLVFTVMWAARIYAEVHAMRVAIESMAEFRESVDEDSREQWRHFDNHEHRISTLEAGQRGHSAQIEVHDREIKFLIESNDERRTA